MSDTIGDANFHAPKDPVNIDLPKTIEVAPAVKESSAAWAPRQVLADGRRVTLTHRDEDPTTEPHAPGDRRQG